MTELEVTGNGGKKISVNGIESTTKPTTPKNSELLENIGFEGKISEQDWNLGLKLLKESQNSTAIKYADELTQYPDSVNTEDVVYGLVKLLVDPTDTNLVLGILLTIQNFSDRDALSHWFVNLNGLENLIPLLSSEDPKVARTSLKFLLYLLSEGNDSQNLSNAEAFGVAKGIPHLVKLLDHEEPLPSLVAWILRILVSYQEQSSVDFVSFIVRTRTNIFPSLCKMLESKNVQAKKLAQGVFSDLAAYPTESKVLPPLTKMLKGKDMDLIVGALHALRFYIYKNQESKIALYNTGVLDDVISFLGNSSASVANHAANLLVVWVECEKVKKEVVAKLPQMLSLLSFHNPAVEDSVLCCLQEVVDHNITAQETLIRDKKAFDTLFDLLGCGRTLALTKDWEILTSLALGNTRVQEIAAKKGIADHLAKLLKHPDESLQRHAAYAVWAFTRNYERNQKCMAKAGIIEILVDLLHEEKSDKCLKQYCSGALIVLVMENDKNKEVLGPKGVKVLISNLSEEENETLQLNSVKALWASCTDNVKNQEAASEAFPALSKLLVSKNLSIQTTTIGCITVLATKNVKNQNDARNAGILQEISKLTKDYVNQYKEDSSNHQVFETLRSIVSCLIALTLKNETNTHELASLTEVLSPLSDDVHKEFKKDIHTFIQNVSKEQNHKTLKNKSQSFQDLFHLSKEKDKEHKEKEGKESDSPPRTSLDLSWGKFLRPH